jgi:membrane-associated phospholipid phosphatase
VRLESQGTLRRTVGGFAFCPRMNTDLRLHRSRPVVRLARVALAVAAWTGAARAADDCPLVPFGRLGETAQHLGEPLPLLLITGSVAPPLAFAPAGVDHHLRLVAQRDLGGRHGLEPVSVIAPYAIAAGVLVGYGVSLAAGACAWQRPQAAVLQAMALTFGTVALLKWTVGREWPAGGGDPDAPDRLEHPERAESFRPFQNGFGAWPSGHTAVAFSAAAALRTSVADLGWPAWLGYPIAVAIGVGMWIGDHHFASDILSGALLGEAIGASTGKAFAKTPETPSVAFGRPSDGPGVVAAYRGVW